MKNFDTKSFLKLFFVGFAMGSADVVPGVSGGTIAYITGVYQKLISGIKSATTDALSLVLKGKILDAIKNVHYSFLIPLGFGIITAVLSFAKFLDYSLEHYPTYLFSFFFGLVLASIYLIGKDIKKISKLDLVIVVVSTLLSYIFVGLVPREAPASILMSFISGAIAISVMVLPGISGSFMLLIMGQYNNIITAVHERDLIILIPFLIGIVVGLSLFVKVVTYLFNRYAHQTILFLLGLMIGSLRKIWPYKVQEYIQNGTSEPTVIDINLIPAINTRLFISLGLIILGAIIILLFEKFSANKKDQSVIED